MTMKEIDEKAAAQIAEHGFMVFCIFPDEESGSPSFAYTVGLEETSRHAEICMAGLPTDVLMQLVRDAGARIVQGRKMDHDDRIDKLIRNFDVVIKDSPPTTNLDDVFVRAAVYYGEPNAFRMRQLFWPDAKGNFPWEADCDERYKTAQCALLGYNFDKPQAGAKFS